MLRCFNNNAKVFCVGFNKCATTSFAEYFRKYKMNTIDNPKWHYPNNKSILNKHNVFTDMYERYEKTPVFPDLSYLESTYPDSKYILQTRALKDWLSSRYYQVSFNYLNGFENKLTIDEEVIRRWIDDRNYWYKEVYEYFKKKNNLLIIDINDRDIKIKIDKFLNLIKKNMKFPHIHKSTKSIKSCTKNINKDKCKENVMDFLEKYVEKDDWDTTGICKYL